MTQFRYRLQTLLDEKIRVKKSAQQALGAAESRLRAEQEELEVCRREEEAVLRRLKRAQEEMISSPAVRGAAGELIRGRRDFILGLQQDLDAASGTTRAQEFRVGEAEEGVAAARDSLTAASREVEVLEKHRSRLENRFNQAAGRRDALEQDEMGNLVFLRRGKTI